MSSCAHDRAPHSAKRPAEYRRSSDAILVPKAVRSETEMGRLLLALEVPDCSCPPVRKHACCGECNPDDYCACCLGECSLPGMKNKCPLAKVHICEGARGLCDPCPPAGKALSCLCCFGGCDCPVLLPICAHVRAAGKKFPADVTLKEWSRLLLDYGEGYREPPEPKEGAVTLGHRHRKALYATRAKGGLSIRHPEDRHGLPPEEEAVAARQMNREWLQKVLAEMSEANLWQAGEATPAMLLAAFRAREGRAPCQP